MPIRCVCPNGHPLRVKDKMAGMTGTCPKCKARFTVPDTSESPSVAEETVASPELEETAAVSTAPPPELEWRLADPSGQQYGPTLPAIFAQWIQQGRVRPDWHVWRSDWPDWRLASDAADDLPAPLPDSPAAPPLPATEAKESAAEEDEARPPEIESEKEDLIANADEVYLRRKKKSALRKKLLVVGMTIACLSLGGMLFWLLLTNS